MSDRRKIGIAVPTWNRFGLLKECLSGVIGDPRIHSITISDDCCSQGTWDLIREWAGMMTPRTRIDVYRNDTQQDCYRNKKLAMERSGAEWVILFDDDNILTKAYLDALYALTDWSPQVAYCPEFAEPHFDFRHLSGKLVNRVNVTDYMGDDRFLTMLNAMNYFIHREEFLRVWDPEINPHTADSIYQNYRWLDRGNFIFVVPGLRYFHRVHKDNHYKNNVHKTGSFAREVEEKLSKLK